MLLASAVIIFSQECPRSPDVVMGQVRELQARRNFFQTAFGTLSILPRATNRPTANEAGTFWVMQSGALQAVKAQHHPVWLQFNHHLPVSDGTRRHLGALVIVLTAGAGRKQVEVYRNHDWRRASENEILGEFSKSPDLSWEGFVAVSHESSATNAKRQRVDDAFQGPWHAIPCKGNEDQDSWSYRDFWDWAVLMYKTTVPTVLGEASRVDRCRVSARLIAYTPTLVPASKRPVVFDVNASKGDYIFLAAYSLYNSGQDARSWYWLQLK